jgi:hypothetical protein
MKKKLIVSLVAICTGAALSVGYMVTAQSAGCAQYNERGTCRVQVVCPTTQLFDGVGCVDPPAPEEPAVEPTPAPVVPAQTATPKRGCYE